MRNYADLTLIIRVIHPFHKKEDKKKTNQLLFFVSADAFEIHFEQLFYTSIKSSL